MRQLMTTKIEQQQTKPSMPMLNRRQAIATGLAVVGSSVSVSRFANAQEPAATAVDDSRSEATTRLNYAEPKTQTWRIGLRLETPITCANVIATFPIPMDWPEQTVTVTSKQVDSRVSSWLTRDLAGGVRQVALMIPQVNAGQTAEVLFEFDVARSKILPPTKTDDLTVPRRTPRELRIYTGNSPYIDASSAYIRAVSKTVDEADAANDWQRVERIYDYVREHVRYTEGPIRNASEALRVGEGDCEEMTSLFIAMCRNARIPARMVWIPDHCYPEFYLEDPEGNGHWFPCQAAGTRQFGEMDEYRPVIQKGDRFKPPESKTPTRYVAEFFKCDKRGSRDPRPEFVREQLFA